MVSWINFFIGDAKAEKINLFAKEKLNEFGLNILKNIVCCVKMEQK